MWSFTSTDIGLRLQGIVHTQSTVQEYSTAFVSHPLSMDFHKHETLNVFVCYISVTPP
jgi:hypothetical protein